MPFNPWTLGRPERKPETRTFRDRGGEVTLTFLRPNTVEASAADALTKQYVETWVESGSTFPCGDAAAAEAQGEEGAIYLNETILRSIAILETLEQGPENERLGLSNWVGLSLTMPKAWREINLWAQTFLTPEDDAAGNSSGAPAAA